MEFEYMTEETAQKFNNLLKETIEFCHNKRNYNKTSKDMNENIDLTKILKDCPKGTKFYSTIFGEVEFFGFCDDEGYAITIKRNYNIANITKDGRYITYFNGECILFPSKEQRDWSKFTAPWYKKETDINSMSNKDDERLRKTTIAFLEEFAEQGYENALECIDWLEKQYRPKPQGKSALEAIKEEKVDNANKK